MLSLGGDLVDSMATEPCEYCDEYDCEGDCPRAWANWMDNEGGLAEMFGRGDNLDDYRFSDELKAQYKEVATAYEALYKALEAEGGTL